MRNCNSFEEKKKERKKLISPRDKKKKDNELRTYSLSFIIPFIKSDSRGNGNIASASAGYKHAGRRKCVSSKIYTTEDHLTLERSR